MYYYQWEGTVTTAFYHGALCGQPTHCSYPMRTQLEDSGQRSCGLKGAYPSVDWVIQPCARGAGDTGNSKR